MNCATNCFRKYAFFSQESGAVFSLTDYNSRNALHVAASNGNTEATKFLLQNGVNVHAKWVSEKIVPTRRTVTGRGRVVRNETTSDRMSKEKTSFLPLGIKVKKCRTILYSHLNRENDTIQGPVGLHAVDVRSAVRVDGVHRGHPTGGRSHRRRSRGGRFVFDLSSFIISASDLWSLALSHVIIQSNHSRYGAVLRRISRRSQDAQVSLSSFFFREYKASIKLDDFVWTPLRCYRDFFQSIRCGRMQSERHGLRWTQRPSLGVPSLIFDLAYFRNFTFLWLMLTEVSNDAYHFINFNFKKMSIPSGRDSSTPWRHLIPPRERSTAGSEGEQRAFDNWTLIFDLKFKRIL